MDQNLMVIKKQSSNKGTIENMSLYEESVHETDTDIMDSHHLLQKYIYQNQQLNQKLYTVNQEKDICQRQSMNLKSFYEQEIEYYKNKADMLSTNNLKKTASNNISSKIQFVKQSSDVEASLKDLQENYKMLEIKNQNQLQTISVLSNKVHELQNQLESQEKEFKIYTEHLNQLVKEKDNTIIEKEQNIQIMKNQRLSDPHSIINCSQISFKMPNFQKQMQEITDIHSQNGMNQSHLYSVQKMNFIEDLQENMSDYEMANQNLIEELKTKVQVQQKEIEKYQEQIKQFQKASKSEKYQRQYRKYTKSLDRKTQIFIQQNQNNNRRYTNLNATQSNQNQNNVTIITSSHKENGYQLLYEQSQTELNNQKNKVEHLKQENNKFRKKVIDFKKKQEQMKYLLEATKNCSELYKDKYMKLLQNNSNLTTKHSELFEKSQQYSQFLKQNNEKIKQDNNYKNSLIQSASSRQSFLIQQNQKVNNNFDAIDRL